MVKSDVLYRSLMRAIDHRKMTFALLRKGEPMSKDCEGCEWYRYPMLTDNSLNNKPILTVITDLRRCERGWCDKEGEQDETD